MAETTACGLGTASALLVLFAAVTLAAAVPPRPKIDVSPDPTTVGVKTVSCRNQNYPGCYYKEWTCPSTCPRTCEVDCVTCRPVCNCDKPGAVCQDPRFIGGDGLAFYFHGKKDRDFCLVTDPAVHINAHFIGKRNENMTRDFTWVQALGIRFDNHQLYVGAKKTAIWNDAIDRIELRLDGVHISIPASKGASWRSPSAPSLAISRSHIINDVVIEVAGNFKIKAVVVPITKKESIIHQYGITNDDCFAHLDLSFKFYSLSGDVNGVLGQTYAHNYVSRIKMGVKMPVLGGNKEFAASDIFATDCEVGRFAGTGDDGEGIKFDNDILRCGDNESGNGMICKR